VAEVTIELIAAGIIAILAAIAGAFRIGRKSAVTKAEAAASKEYISTRRAMDEEDDNLGGDPALARRFLHERGQRGRDL
jgi:hypothetical protein